MKFSSRHLVSAALLALVTGCGDGTSPGTGTNVDQIVIILQHPLGDPAVLAGETLQLSATVYDSDGTPISDATVTWLSADEATAAVSSTGLVSGFVPGFVQIRARAGNKADTVALMVLERAASLAPLPTVIGIVPGGQTDVITGFRNAAGAPLEPFGRTVDWASSNPSVASFSYGGIPAGATRGTVIAQVPGSATITVTSPEATASIPVDVSLLTFTSIGTAYRTSCGLTNTGRAYCWGVNFGHQLANPIVNGSATPLRVEGVESFASITPGGSETCGIATGGAAYCWGDNSFGQLGNGTSEVGNGISTPTPVVGGLHFSTLSAGEVSVCGLTSSGNPYCWGGGYDGELGNGGTANSSVPVLVSGGLTLTSISLFSRHACGIAADGSAYCWGNNIDGQLGDNSTTNRSAPVAVTGTLSFTAISTGIRHTCGISGSQAYCWGDNSFGEMGSSGTGSTTPVALSGGIQFSSVSAGYTHSCGLTSAGVAYCWGLNDVGQLGDGSNSDSTSPVPVSGGYTFSSIKAGDRYTCGLSVEPVLYCWGGSDNEGATGSSTIGSTVPVRVTGQP